VVVFLESHIKNLVRRLDAPSERGPRGAIGRT
jgi:hypothetical protein